MHDAARARALVDRASASDGADPEATPRATYFADAAAGNWLAAAADARAYQAAMIRSKTPLSRVTTGTLAAPLLAVALARAGDIAAARAEISASPVACVACENARGEIEVLAGNRSVARHWFAHAIGDAPSIPFAYAHWGEMLLRKGDFDGAIAKFESAHEKGPHFADPLEMWGEALIAKNRSDLAVANFQEAAKYAPHWGRLHLKWGEALLWSTDKEGAQKQFALARTLDLTPSEKSELARVAHG
jgi:tetratricopeptide (TPR) repeat protein